MRKSNRFTVKKEETSNSESKAEKDPKFLGRKTKNPEPPTVPEIPIEAGIRCTICLEYDNYTKEKCVQCNKCLSYFHPKCFYKYISKELFFKDGKYLCNICQIRVKTEKCCFCGESEGILKKVNPHENQYGHSYCFYFYSEYCNPTKDPYKFRKHRTEKNCCICQTKNGIPALQCCTKGCFRHFHVKCAIEHHLIVSLPFMRIHYKIGNSPENEDIPEAECIPVHCSPHTKGLYDAYLKHISNIINGNQKEYQSPLKKIKADIKHPMFTTESKDKERQRIQNEGVVQPIQPFNLSKSMINPTPKVNEIGKDDKHESKDDNQTEVNVIKNEIISGIEIRTGKGKGRKPNKNKEIDKLKSGLLVNTPHKDFIKKENDSPMNAPVNNFQNSGDSNSVLPNLSQNGKSIRDESIKGTSKDLNQSNKIDSGSKIKEKEEMGRSMINSFPNSVDKFKQEPMEDGMEKEDKINFNGDTEEHDLLNQKGKDKDLFYGEFFSRRVNEKEKDETPGYTAKDIIGNKEEKKSKENSVVNQINEITPEKDSPKEDDLQKEADMKLAESILNKEAEINEKKECIPILQESPLDLINLKDLKSDLNDASLENGKYKRYKTEDDQIILVENKPYVHKERHYIYPDPKEIAKKPLPQFFRGIPRDEFLKIDFDF
ncbi:MAG: hypothetical protein MJ252_17605 [archaeon]|nr:hypothetical protein [archaeon]